jgi:aldehyde dehydrogenase (NAD+)
MEDGIGTVPEATPADADRAVAVAAARQAFGGWSGLVPAARGEVLERFAAALEKRGEETARRVTMQNGMPW